MSEHERSEISYPPLAKILLFSRKIRQKSLKILSLLKILHDFSEEYVFDKVSMK